MNNKLPTIFLYELELWDGIDLLIGEEYDNIKEILNDKQAFNEINNNLQDFSLPLSKNKWHVNLIKNTDSWETIPNKPIKENNYNHLIANFSGLMMVCLFNPSTDNLNIINNNDNIKKILENNEKIPNNLELDYILIPIRPSNMIYIPYGWHYWIYSGVNNSNDNNNYCCYIDCINQLLF